MKLWIKLSGIALLATLLAISVCLYVFVSWQRERIISGAQEEALSSFKLLCTNLKSTDPILIGSTDTQLTERSITQFRFSQYSHLLAGDAYYSLVQDGEYLYNTCPYNLVALIHVPENMETSYTVLKLDGYQLVAVRQMSVISQVYTVYMCADITYAYDELEVMTRMSIFMLLLSAAVVLLITVPLVRHALTPVQTLTVTADQISGGEYHLRADIHTHDEVAELATSFNHMTDAVEERIDALTEQSNRKQLLLGALAHELKTPMTAIIGFADSLLKMPLTEEQRQHCTEQILTAGYRVERMSAKLMQLISIGEEANLEKKPFSTASFARALQNQYSQRITITVAVEKLYGEYDLILCAVQNLINNALNAIANDSSVEVMIGDGTISVIDHGCGIAPEHIARLTEPFYRVDKARSRAHGGAGLGLALCMVIIKAHGGSMNIASTLGQGTTVTLHFGTSNM